MKSFSQKLMITQIVSARRARHITRQQLSGLTGISRGMIVCLEAGDYMSSIEQLDHICSVLDLDAPA